MKTKVNEAITNVLKQFGDKYFIDDVLHKNKVIQDLDNYDEKLLEAFISNETLKNNFTIDIAGNIVLQTNKLIKLFEADEYWQDSYTKYRSEEHTSELQSRGHLVCRLLLEKKKKNHKKQININ